MSRFDICKAKLIRGIFSCAFFDNYVSSSTLSKRGTDCFRRVCPACFLWNESLRLRIKPEHMSTLHFSAVHHGSKLGMSSEDFLSHVIYTATFWNDKKVLKRKKKSLVNFTNLQ